MEPDLSRLYPIIAPQEIKKKKKKKLFTEYLIKYTIEWK